jgi:hypothetical protein
MRHVAILTALCFLSGTSLAEETLIQFGSPMVFLANQADPGIGLTWTQADFDDSSWPAGTYGVGYDTSSSSAYLLATRVPLGTSSVYTRTTFTVSDPAGVKNLFLGADYDDGYVAWVNGVEVFRAKMPSTGREWNASASDHESSNGKTPNYGTLNDISAKALPALREGINVLAVGVWNTDSGSSDLVLVPKLVRDRDPTVTRGPYLQMAAPTSMTVRWRTDYPTDTRVRWGITLDNLVYATYDSRLATDHAVRVNGLQPNTRYYYTVGSSAKVLAGGSDYLFVTPPPVGTVHPLRIWALGDSGTANSSAKAVRDAYYAFNASRYTDLWLMLGDNAYSDGTDSNYQKAVFDIYPTMLRSSVLWPTLGNHDGHTANSSKQSGPYYDIFTLPRSAEAGGVASGTEAYYSFDVSNAHFICLESYETDRSPGGAMLTWLREDLASTSQTWVIAFWHHPPYSKGSHDSDVDTEMIEMRQNALPILEEAGADLVLSGHSHSYERSYLIDGHYGSSLTFSDSYKVDGGDGREGSGGVYRKSSDGPAPHEGAVYVVAGCSGKTEGGDLNHPAMFLSLNVLGSLVLDLNGDRLDVRFLDKYRATQDSFTILKGGSVPGATDRAASEEVPVTGTVSGSYRNTRSADGLYESILEAETVGPTDTTRIHYLEHKWMLEVAPGSDITFFLKGYQTPSASGDHFTFAYSTDDANYQDFLTMNWTEDDGSYRTASLPPSLSGRVYLQVLNTNREPQDLALVPAAIYLDHFFIRSQ